MNRILATAFFVLTVYSISLWQDSTKIERDAEAEWIAGYNMAIRQFAPLEKVDEMVIKKERYTALGKHEKSKNLESDESPYADGYHKALQIMTEKNNCPRQ